MHLPKYENKPFKPPRRIVGDGIAVPVSTKSAGTKRTISRDVCAPQPEIKRLKAPDPNQGPKDGDLDQKIYTMMYRKPTNKKHKTWNGDGYAVSRSSSRLAFYDDTGKFIGSSLYTEEDILESDTVYRSAGLEMQLDYQVVTAEELQEVQAILKQSSGTAKSGGDRKTADLKTLKRCPIPPVSSPVQLEKKLPTPKFKSAFKPSKVLTPLAGVKKTASQQYRPVFDITKIDNPVIMNKAIDADVDVIVDPIIGNKLRPHQREGVKFMYDCVCGLARPSSTISEGSLKKDDTSTSLILERDSDINGCLLADEMGLGKTLMTIALIWTLLKQTPMASHVPCSQSGVPLQGLCSKVLIVCPVTLIANWKREFGKWLNLSRIGILTLSASNTADKDKYDVRNFLKVQRTYQVLIIGYEKLLTVSEELKLGKESLDLLVCDEGHRLKNSSSKILNILKALDINKKVLLSGTPIQNDLNEFYTVVDFINAGILGSFTHFKQRYMNPILRARDPANRFNELAVEKGEAKSKELIEITQKFTLRRTNSILQEFLPPRTDMIIFCQPTVAQTSAFRDILQGAQVDLKGPNFRSSLALITLLKKVSNSPSLINSDPFYRSTLESSNISTKYERALNSGKLKVLMTLLERIKNGTDGEKVVVVSNYTQTLDIIENLMRSADMKICRLDGSTQSKERDPIVTSFNRDPSIFAFLLSAKSGGVGLNLIGASRLVLFDNDWNPSVDLQAMSRIHRDGQKRSCYIYRLITTGCIDEKILQRQLVKHSLSQKFLCDSKAGEGHSDDDLFNKEDLRDLFTVHRGVSSNTHDLICNCDGDGKEIDFEDEAIQEVAPSPDKVNSLGVWQTAFNAQQAIQILDYNNETVKSNLMKKCLVGYRHINPKKVKHLWDSVATEVAQRLPSDISFVFVKPAISSESRK